MTTTTSNSESLLSVLCSETWHWDSRDENQIIFEKNGTGKLICRAELNVWIAAQFDWKAKKPESLGQILDLSSSWFDFFRSPRPVAKLDIELTLTKRRIPSLGAAEMDKYTINEELLTDDAFLPKTYTITLEKGKFKTPFDAMAEKELPYTPKFALRLVFDKSPYAPREEWKEPSGAPDAIRFWEWRKFCGRRLP